MSKMHLFIWLIFIPSFSALLPSQEVKRESVQAPVFRSSCNSCSVTECGPSKTSVLPAKERQLLHSAFLMPSLILKLGICPCFLTIVISLFCQVGVCNNWVQNRILKWFGLKEMMAKSTLLLIFLIQNAWIEFARFGTALKNGIPGVWPKPRCPALPWVWSTINTTETAQ